MKPSKKQRDKRRFFQAYFEWRAQHSDYRETAFDDLPSQHRKEIIERVKKLKATKN